ncbi:MAG: ABC transporter ATP-binding protein [Chloroflexota bacterium]|nr:ABC transporter ATP-binding protein [Chloroflexota bacterium]
MVTHALLVADDITHHFRSTGGEVLALRDVSLRVQEGEFVALVGPSGCGKTTLLRMFGGLLLPEVGRILYKGEPLIEPPSDIGMVFQKPALLPWRTVVDNVRLPLEVAGKARDPERIADLVEAVGLTGFEEALPAELSGGMQQRVSLARALINHPRLLLMDEPFGALDTMLRNEMNHLLLDLWQRTQPTVLFVTHDIHEAVFLADRVITMSPRPGRVVGNFPIDLPRPRNTLERYSRDVQEYVERIWHTIESSQHGGNP